MRRTMLMAAVAFVAAPGLQAQNMRTVTMSRQIEDDNEVAVDVEYAVGRFTVRSVGEGLLYRMNLRYDEDRFEPVAEYSNHRLELGVESIRRGRLRGARESGELDLELGRGVPMDLELQFGAVRAELDLGGLMLTGLDLHTGASESTIDISEPNRGVIDVASFEVGAAEFVVRGLGNLNAERIELNAGVGSLVLGLDGAWEREARLDIEMGLGALELRVPEGIGLRINKDSFLTSLDSEGLVKRGDTFESLDWAEASRRVTVDLDAAFGSVEVVWVR